MTATCPPSAFPVADVVRDRLVYAPGLRSVILRWIWGRPGPEEGWRLQLPGDPEDQALRPPRRGLGPDQIGAWMDQTLTAHGWQRAEATSWPPATLPRFVTTMAVVPARSSTKTKSTSKK